MRGKVIGGLVAAVLIAAVVWAVAASGGDDGGGDGDKASVRLWIMNNGPQPVADMRKTVKPFEEETGIDVKVELVGWDVQFDRIRNAAISGRGPDVTQAGTTQVPFFAALDGFEDLADRVGDIGGAEAYADGVWATSGIEGQDAVFGIPWFTEARAIYYRKDALEAAGVDEATAFADWDSFRSTLEALSEVKELDGETLIPFGSPGKQAFDLVHHVMPFVWSNGGAELSEDASTSTIASDEAVDAVKFIADLLPAGLYDKTALERDGTQVEETFKGGRLAVWMGGPWVLASTDREDDEAWTDAARQNVGIAPMPQGPTGEAATFVGGSNLMVFKSSENKDEAWQLIEFLSQDQTQTAYADLMGMFPARLDPQQAIGEQDENYQAFFEAIQQGRTYAAIPQWGQVENAYKTRFGNILDAAAGQGGGSYSREAIQAELQEAEKEANGLLEQDAG